MKLIAMDAMVLVDLDENVVVTCEPNEDDMEDASIYLSFHIGENDDEVCFAIDRENAGRWIMAFHDAARRIGETDKVIRERIGRSTNGRVR